ncbi:MAG TPA: AAA family ATPase, partial [Gemmatimonadales bacterium]|nr:AAA family ATPase [Gemmatimonadales bacterium]
LYEMLAGQPPFTGTTMQGVLMRHLTVEPRRITDLAPGVPRPVAAALARALAKAPADRFDDMKAFATALTAPEAPTGAPPPAQLTSFIGRERETASVRELLQQTRALTLTGAGGSGKTRLALQVASSVAGDYPDGVAWVELAPLSNPDLVADHVADALGVRRDGMRSAGDALLEALRDWNALLVLDNCEHLVPACAGLSAALLQGAPRLRILATSREPLGIEGERAWLVPPLALPALSADEPVTRAAAATSEAVRLFVERAQAVRPSFDLIDGNAAAIVQICRRLDGLPLAIELAAARARILDPRQIAARLDDVFALLRTTDKSTPPRHRTLHSTIAWSHDLLTDPERVLFRRLAVFTGGFTVDAAEAVAGTADVLDLLSSLVDKSLVTLETEALESRYRMLETVRQFAQQRLEEAGEAAQLGRSHAQFFLARAEAAEPFLSNQTEGWQERLAADIGNLRAAADWLEQDPDAIADAMRLAAALFWFWFGLGHYREAGRRLEAALARSGNTRTRTRGRALAALATIMVLQGRPETLRSVASESVDILRETAGPSVDLLYALVGLGQAELLGGDLDGAERTLTEALALARTIQPRYWITYALYWHGRVAQALGRLETARAEFDEGVTLGLADGYNQPIAHLSTIRGHLALIEGDATAALGWFAVALPPLVQMQNHWSSIIVVEDVARIAAERGDAERAARLLGAAANLREEAGAAPMPPEREAIDRLTTSVRDTLGPVAFVAAFQVGKTLTLTQALDLGKTLMGEPSRAEARPRAGVPRLVVTALGSLGISVDGTALEPSAWQSLESRDLLLYLLCHPAGRTREQIGRAFWPDASPAQIKNSLHVTLDRLRRTLGRPDWIVFEEGRYRINPQFRVEFDALQFEAAVHSARDAAARQRALERYKGDFLKDAGAGDWHVELQERWRQVFEKAVSKKLHF